jgi:hypothetical protein
MRVAPRVEEIRMPRAHISLGTTAGAPAASLEPDLHLHGRALTCGYCSRGLECVEQNRRSGTWLGSFICPHCRSEYFYAYRWGRLLKKT